MSSYILRDVDREQLDAFRAACHAVGRKPGQVLKRFIAEVRIDYRIASDTVRVEHVVEDRF